MRTTLVMLALLAAGTAAIAGSASPVSSDSWCVYGGELGYSGDCSYWTREQCLASASGRWNTYCDVNRRLLFQQQDANRRRSLFEQQEAIQRQGVQQRGGNRRH